MENDNSRMKLVRILESRILNLDDQKKYLKERKDELESVSRLLAYTKDNIEMVGIYADQELITTTVEKLGCNKDDYKASCYLLKSDDPSVKSLPQYVKAYELISDIIEFFKLHKAELIVEIGELKDSCEKKELEKKYFDILSNTNPLIEDIEEFKIILNNYDLSNDDKINILTDVINNNILNYKKDR